ncbi:MAG: hypothetical protein HYZ57_00265 [Acidobacteria bacterium]|nr:hypothetical protein [Acidobacteriota bacterium]
MDVDKTIEFILDNQARFSVALQQLAETQIAQAKRLDRMEEVDRRLGERIDLLAAAMMGLTENVERLTKHADETDRRMKETDERMKETDQRMRATDERLNALIQAVHDLIRRGPNGSTSAAPSP